MPQSWVQIRSLAWVDRARRMADIEDRQDGVLVNALTGMGMPGRDRSLATTLAPPEFLNEQDLDTLYISSWLCRKVVNIWASEATRMGWDIGLGDDTKKARKQSDGLVAAGEKLRLRKHVRRAVQLARHQGGSVLVMFVDDGAKDPSLPINWRRLKAIRGLHALDRWRIWPAPTWRGVGTPEAYQFNSNNDADLAQFGVDGSQVVTIHGSRVLRFEGRRSHGAGGRSSAGGECPSCSRSGTCSSATKPARPAPRPCSTTSTSSSTRSPAWGR